MRRLLVTMLLAMTALAAANAQWTQTMGPEGGFFNTIATTGDEMLGATWQGDIYRWDIDAGWSLVSSLYRPTLFTAGNSYLAISEDTLYRSTDHGASWQPTGRTGQYMGYAVDGSVIYITQSNSIYRSADDGATWELVASPEIGSIGAIWAHGSNLIVTVAGGTDMLRSTDNGVTWGDGRVGLPYGLAPFQFFGEGSTIYISMPSSGFFRSTDAGASWIGMNESLPNYEGGYPMMTDMVIYDDQIIATNSAGVFHFNGIEWSFSREESDILLEKRGSVLYKASRRGVSRSEHGWSRLESINAGLRAVDVTAFARSGENIAAAGSLGLYVSSDMGMTWGRSLPNTVEELATIGSTILARGWQIGSDQEPSTPGVLRSTDNGMSWQNSSAGIGDELVRISALATNSTTAFAGFNETFGFHGVSHWQAGGVYRSSDNGATWIASSSGLPSDGFSLVPIIDLVATDRVVIATTLAGVYRSTDNGATWRKSAGAPSYDDGIGIMLAEGNTIDLAVKNRIYRSTDDGANWIPVETGLEEFAYIYNMQLVGSDLILFANESSGRDHLLRFDGTTWKRIDGEFPDGVTFRTFLVAGDRLLGGSTATSVWSMPLGTVSAVPVSGAASRVVTVSPNPFLSEATLDLTLASAAHVRLDIIDMLGRHIATLQNGDLGAGRHRIGIEGTDLAAGRYMYRLDVDGEVTGGLVVKNGE